jgi:hypothetical protein
VKLEHNQSIRRVKANERERTFGVCVEDRKEVHGGGSNKNKTAGPIKYIYFLSIFFF